MPTSIFVNFPVKDLARSMEFFKKLGYTFNPQFTDETAACMRIDESIYSMLLTHEKFQTFTTKTIADATTTTEVAVALSCDSRQAVDELVDKAIAAGGLEVRPAQDHGFMYERPYQDLDGHVWEIFWMDPAAVQ
jgi:predicted lactoylglutathione lyase